MDIEITSYEKDNVVNFTVGKRDCYAFLVDYDITGGSKEKLEMIFFPYQVDHIAKRLKEKMLDAEHEKNKNGQVEDKPETLEKEIKAVCDEMANFLIEKNKAYGNSAAEPVGIFAKRLNPLDQIDVRIDDKLNRLQKGHEYPGDDTIVDLAGYLILRMIVAKSA